MRSLRLRQAEHQHARRVHRRGVADWIRGFLSNARARSRCRHRAPWRRPGCRGSEFAPPSCARRFGRVNQRAVRCEHGERFVIGEQAADTLGKRQRRSRRLGRGDQDRGLAVRNNEARAGAGQRAAEAQPESAQAFEARRTGRRQAWRRGGQSARRPGCWCRSGAARIHAYRRRQTAPRRPHSPTASARHRRSTARRAMGSSPAPPVADHAIGRALTLQTSCDGTRCLRNS